MPRAKRKLRMGMAGGGRGAFIGAVHRMAAQLDGEIELVCGAFSADAKKSLASGRDWFLSDKRCYRSCEEMMAREADLPPGERMDFVTIVTPNHLHAPIAHRALNSGFHVMCDKPMTLDLAEAKRLARQVASSGLVFGLMHNYTGYPMVKEARERIRAGQLGSLRKVVVEYPQGWLAEAVEKTGQKQASWRTDPKRAGASCSMGDIGIHAANLAEYITGLRMEACLAELTSFVRGRKLDDDGSVLLRFKGGARGILMASQVSVGEENALRIRVYGERGGLEWAQEEPNSLIMKWPDRPREIVRAGSGSLSAAARAACRLPPGHPEGFIEAFANVYRNFAAAVRGHATGKKGAGDFPGVEEGVRGMAFIEAVVASARKSAWTKLP